MDNLLQQLLSLYIILGDFNGQPSNPAHEVTFPANYVDLYEQNPKAIKSFGIRILTLLESANIKPQYSSLVYETT